MKLKVKSHDLFNTRTFAYVTVPLTSDYTEQCSPETVACIDF